MRAGARPAVERPVQSFDVFDTCLVRTYLEPDDLVYDCAERVLRAATGRSPFQEDVAELAERRLSAHRRLLDSTGRDEVTLDEIYASMGDLHRWGIAAAAMRETELSLERSCSRPVAATAAAVARARVRGQRVVFISDMWLDQQFVRELLLDAGIAEPDDVVRVSSTQGRSKWTGRLFQDVLDELAVRPVDVHHRGDNPHTDYAVPRSLGIAATLVTPTALTRYERLALLEDGPRHVRSRLAGAGRSVRLAYDDAAGSLERAASDLAADVAGPLLTAFVAWTLEQARQDGVDHLLFVARDGQIMLRTAQALMAGQDALRSSYLEVSRKSLLMAGLPDVGMASLEQVLPPRSARTPRRALAALGLDIESLTEPTARAGLRRSRWDEPATGQRAAALARLLTDREVQERLARAVEDAAAGVRGYLEQEGLLSGDTWALVDIGWNLRLQRVLKDLTGRTDDRPLGYYLGARPEGVAQSRPGRYRAFLLEGLHEPGGTSPGALVLRQHTAVEALITPGDHGSVRSYERVDGRWQPVHGPRPDDARRRYVARLHEGVVRYAHEATADGLLPDHLRLARHHGLAVTALFLSDPQRSELHGLQALRHADDVAQDLDQPVVGPLTVPLVIRTVADRLRSRPRARLVWSGSEAPWPSRADRCDTSSGSWSGRSLLTSRCSRPGPCGCGRSGGPSRRSVPDHPARPVGSRRRSARDQGRASTPAPLRRLARSTASR